MPVQNYSMLKGRPIAMRLGTQKTKHYQIEISADGEIYRIAVNVESGDGSEVEYAVKAPFKHPILDLLPGQPQGMQRVPSQPGGLALDFIRANLVQPSDFVALPISASGPDNDLNDKVDRYVQRAMADENAMVYAFGATWGPESKADNYFGFKPGQGIHDIHFNQGNPPGPFAKDNGVWQDGGLFFEFPDEKLWVAMFMKFQTQAWHSSEAAPDGSHPGGDLIAPVATEHPDKPELPVNFDQFPTEDMPDGMIRIVGAYVNDIKSPEHETVTLLNTTDHQIDLTGWQLIDKQAAATRLAGSIGAGEALRVDVVPPMTLSNKGGTITLLNGQGLKVHGVAYTKDQAQPGRTVTF